LHETNLRYEYASTRSEFIFASEKAIPVFLSVLSASLACFIYSNFPRAVQVTSLDASVGYLFFGFRFFNKKWYYDQVYNYYIVYPLLRLGHAYTFKTLDRGFVELLGPTGLVRFWLQSSELISRWQSGYIFNYVFSMVMALVFVLLWVRIFAAPAVVTLFAVLFCAACFLQHSARRSITL
jgi:NADH-ubiquinone oxidoreductase chain 5